VLVGYPDAILEVAQLRIPGQIPETSTHMLELVEYVAPDGKPLDLATANVGVAHLAFTVSGIHDEHARLSSLGVQFRNPPVAIEEGANRGGFSCYFVDPDGITLELLQRPGDATVETAA
jgi:catechol 2,3-dioxygenase-like lactoylglutathione lyase family enzyme